MNASERIKRLRCVSLFLIEVQISIGCDRVPRGSLFEFFLEEMQTIDPLALVILNDRLVLVDTTHWEKFKNVCTRQSSMTLMSYELQTQQARIEALLAMLFTN